MTPATIYNFGGLRGPEDNQARNRALTAIVATGAKLIEIGDLADRVAAVEAATR